MMRWVAVWAVLFVGCASEEESPSVEVTPNSGVITPTSPGADVAPADPEVSQDVVEPEPEETIDDTAQPDTTGTDTAPEDDTWEETDAGSDVEPDGDTVTQNEYPALPPDLEAMIVSNMDQAKVPGLSACVVKDQAIFWCGGFGKSNLELDLDTTEHTPFMLASISKTFTAAALMQLWEAGTLDFDADIDTVLEWDVAHPSDPTPITTQMLLTHHSGIDDNWGAMGQFYAYGQDPELSLQQTVEGYFQPGGTWYDKNANFTPAGPGTSFEYSNMAVALAAHLVEKVTGEDFSERCRREIFEPLGLDNTGWRIADFEALDSVAMPYNWSGSQYKPTGHYTFSDYPDGGLRASAYDLARFMLLHIRGGELDGVQLLAPETVDTALSNQALKGSKPQGWLWYQLSWGGNDWWGHNGGESGVFTEMYFRTSDKMGFVVLMNGDAIDVNPIYMIEDELIAWAENHSG